MTSPKLSDRNFPPLLTFIFGLYRTHMAQAELNALESLRAAPLREMEATAVAQLPGRVDSALHSMAQFIEPLFKWLVHSRENTNWTYDITDLSKDYLASFVSIASNVEYKQIRQYISELDSDKQLKEHIRLHTEKSDCRDTCDSEAKYSRRLGWYALVRARKPKLVVETGLDKGLGSCVLCAALLRNAQEGAPGKYLGIDNWDKAGFLLAPPYSSCGSIVRSDSVTALRQLNEPIDILIADSCHNEGYETSEYSAVERLLSANSCVISDGSPQELRDFALRTGRKFLSWTESPKDHWYPGAAIFIAF